MATENTGIFWIFLDFFLDLCTSQAQLHRLDFQRKSAVETEIEPASQLSKDWPVKPVKLRLCPEQRSQSLHGQINGTADQVLLCEVFEFLKSQKSVNLEV